MTNRMAIAFALAGMVFVLLGIGQVYCVMSLVRGNRKDVLVSAPLASQQEVSLTAAGEVLLMIESPRLAADYRAFQIQWIDKQTGQAQMMNYSFATAQGAAYGLSTVKVPFGRMTAHAGVYVVRIAGLQIGKNYSDYRLILSRPYMGRIAIQVIGIVLCGVGMLLSLIWAAWVAGWLKSGTA
jgi:hypothetical protein